MKGYMDLEETTMQVRSFCGYEQLGGIPLVGFRHERLADWHSYSHFTRVT